MIRPIVAIDLCRGIASDTGIPWRIPGDVAYFRQQTEIGAIVMGRATYEEFDLPLHGRDNFVLTSRPGELRDGFLAIATIEDLPPEALGGDVWVIGGATVYATTLPVAEELLITQIFGDFHCTKFFPAFDDAFSLADAGEEQREGDIRYRFERWKHNTPTG